MRMMIGASSTTVVALTPQRRIPRDRIVARVSPASAGPAVVTARVTANIAAVTTGARRASPSGTFNDLFMSLLRQRHQARSMAPGARGMPVSTWLPQRA